VVTLIEFGFALVAILVAAALFTNAVEILGERLNLAQEMFAVEAMILADLQARLGALEETSDTVERELASLANKREILEARSATRI